MATQKLSQTSLAQVSDLEASWKPLDISDQARAEVLLLQASNYLRQIAFNNSKDIDDMIKADPTGVYGANVRLVVVSAVQREMASPVDMMPDASQWSQSASPYSESMSFTGNVTSTIYFKDKELKLLGLGSVSGKVSTSVMRGVR